MYQALYNKDGSLKHSQECKMVFGRKDPNCPRCAEMLNGSAPRAGWQKDYYHTKKREEQQRANAIQSHNCSLSKCGPVCTAFEW